MESDKDQTGQYNDCGFEHHEAVNSEIKQQGSLFSSHTFSFPGNTLTGRQANGYYRD
jgi:hypothetical protein